MSNSKIQDFFGKPLTIVNVGLGSMAQSVRDQGVPVLDVDWRPPTEELPRLHTTQSGIDIDTANAEACRRIKSGRPVLVGMGIARDVIPGMHTYMILHAGPRWDSAPDGESPADSRSSASTASPARTLLNLE